MSIQVSSLTPCQYLFNRGSESLFPGQDRVFVNQSLETLMRVIDHLVVSKPEVLFVFCPLAFNNQCHLYALIKAQAINQTKIQRTVISMMPLLVGSPTPVPDSVEKVIQGYTEFVDRRFLYLMFFLSYAFITDPKLLVQVVCKALAAMSIAAPSKKFQLFIKDPNHIRTKVSRLALNLLFAEHMKRTFSSNDSPLYSELASVANSDLQLPPSGGKHEGTLYTVPKLAGVRYLLDAISRERIPLLFRVKVITKEGNGSFSYSSQDVRALVPTTPVVVFEMIATDDSYSYVQCREIASQCPSFSRHNVGREKPRHDPRNLCLFCAPSKANVVPYQEKFEPILARPKEMLSALGADFVLQQQRPFLRFFSDRDKFPQLTALFEESVLNIRRYSLSMAEPLNMSVFHVHTDSASHASTSALVMDAPYETHLKARGLI